MRRTLRTAAAAALLVVLAACSLSEEESQIAQGLAQPLGTVDLVLTHDDARCVAETWVGEIGTEPFVEDRLVNARNQVRRGWVRRALEGRFPVSRTTAEGYADGILACVDFDEVSLERRDDQPKPSEEQMDEYADCLRELDDDLWHDGLAATLTGEDSSELDQARSDCEQELR